MRRRRIQGSAVRTHGATGTWPRRNLGPVARTRRCRTTARCVRDGPLGSATPRQGVTGQRWGAPVTVPRVRCPRVRRGGTMSGCAGDGSRRRLSARKERVGMGCVRDGPWGRLSARSTAGRRQRGASSRAGLAAPPGLTVIVTTRPHRKDVTGVPGQESLEHQSPAERRGHPSRGAMDRQALSPRRRCWRPRRRDWGYPAAVDCCRHRLYRRRP